MGEKLIDCSFTKFYENITSLRGYEIFIEIRHYTEVETAFDLCLPIVAEFF